MKIRDERAEKKTWFKNLATGDTFEYLNCIYIKTGITQSEPNAVDLKNGAEDIIRLDADVEQVSAELVVKSNEEEF